MKRMSNIKYNSIWLSNAGVRSCPAPSTFRPAQQLEHVHFDTVVVGGGVFGCTTAYKLKAMGQKVCLFESRTVGSQTSGYSTAKLSAQQGVVYSQIAQQHNDEDARKYYDLNMHGIDTVETIISTLNIDCEFERRAHFTWTNREDEVMKIENEAEVCRRLGIPYEILSSTALTQDLPASIGAKAGISFPNQAQFNPYTYCKELCKHIEGGGSSVYEETRVTSVVQGTPHAVHLEGQAGWVTADNVVLATHLPILDRSMHFAMLEPSRAHCIAARVRGNPVTNMSISVDASISLRAFGDVVVVCGATCKQGDETDTNRLYDQLQEWLHAHFEVEEVLCKWSAMDYYSGDHIPFIGYLYRGSNTLFTATGFSKWGLAAGAAGADIVTQLIHGQAHPRFHDIVDARRWDLMTQWKNLLNENVHTATHMVKDKIKALMPKKKITELAPGEGGIVRAQGSSLGAYRDEEGKLHVVTPVCTHLGCTLVFNDGDKMWDCPCHGSRFDVDGGVVHGPAVKCLHRHEDMEW